MSNQLMYPALFEQWKSHDLAKYRPSFYQGLLPEDEILVWQYIEQHYLDGRYQSLVRVDFEWGAEGLWQIPFPGSVQMGKMLRREYFDMPESLDALIADWHDEIDNNARPWQTDSRIDYEESYEKGFRAALEVKRFLGADFYVEYNPFKELVIADGDVRESDIPQYIRQLSGQTPSNS